MSEDFALLINVMIVDNKEVTMICFTDSAMQFAESEDDLYKNLTSVIKQW